MSHPLSDRFHALLRELGDLHDQKQADYGKDDDPFANVRGAQEWGVEPWVGAMIRLTDKVRRLQRYAEKGSLANEGVEDSLKDIAVYSLIALVLWEQQGARTEDQPRRGTTYGDLDVGCGIGVNPKWWNYTDEKVPF